MDTTNVQNLAKPCKETCKISPINIDEYYKRANIAKICFINKADKN